MRTISIVNYKISDILFLGLNRPSVISLERKAVLFRAGWILATLGATALIGFMMMRSGPNPALIGWLIYLIVGAAILYRPRYGVYATLFFALIADDILSRWYPFLKNFSSSESLFYLQNNLIFSPMETYLILTYISWLGRAAMRRKITFETGPLFWAVITFIGFIVVGLIFGLARGGNVNIGLWEARPIFYMPLMFVLVTNLIGTRKQLNTMFAVIMAAIILESLNGDFFFLVRLHGSLRGIGSITEHSAAIHMNTFFILCISAWIYKASPAKRFLLPLFVPIVGLTYIAAQRRAAFLCLAIACLVLAVLLYREKRRTFWIIIPPLMIVAVIYIGAFWNVTSAIGEPVQAIKSIVAEDQASAEDRSSNLYRVIENINSSYTIHRAPFIGVGFGNKFNILIPMADISTFIWWEYITHNSIAWIWIKTGVGGFIALLFLIGLSLATGARAVRRMPHGDMGALAITASLYILMHFLYAYVDMSWDMQSMIYVGAMMAVINTLEKVVALKQAAPQKRWHWQPERESLPGLRPI